MQHKENPKRTYGNKDNSFFKKDKFTRKKYSHDKNLKRNKNEKAYKDFDIDENEDYSDENIYMIKT